MSINSPANAQELGVYCDRVASDARQFARRLATLSGDVKNRWLLQSAERLAAASATIVQANQRDLQAAPAHGLSEAQVDRLRLDERGVAAIAEALRQIALLPDPVGEVIRAERRPNGLRLAQVRTPLGVVFFIYESRPNVTADAAAICIKSGNAVILRGGKEALHSSQAIVHQLHQAARATGVPPEAIQLIETTDRAAVGHLLRRNDLIDVVIPRGGESLIRRVAAEATMPVIKHYAGNCHVYLDRAAEPEMAVKVTVNAKCQRLGVCNACESLLVHRDAVDRLLPDVAAALTERGIELRGDDEVRRWAPQAQGVTEQDYATEYLGPILSVKIVGSLDEAIRHIERYGSGHTEAIITNDLFAAEQFTQRVDSAAVIVNASTRFHDGGVFGMGAEIGISTDKFHARGPCGLRELTSYKYVVYGQGHVRE